ncbi:adenomatous polyposis coli protein [Caerostris extrusa]|uniref:Adenomatous polyposis coli protein n=1 Tax=Caerostris extrusa TaxID=172846 RepID=A0AAV4WRU2_CAEEX|nr:adenomatous polyposis coli protein [Caerostris extrusa]
MVTPSRSRVHSICLQITSDNGFRYSGFFNISGGILWLGAMTDVDKKYFLQKERSVCKPSRFIRSRENVEHKTPSCLQTEPGTNMQSNCDCCVAVAWSGGEVSMMSFQSTLSDSVASSEDPEEHSKEEEVISQLKEARSCSPEEASKLLLKMTYSGGNCLLMRQCGL